MPNDLKTRFLQLEPTKSTTGIEIVEVDSQIVFRETIGHARSGRRAMQFIGSVFCVGVPFILYLARNDYGFAWLVAVGIAVYTLYRLFQDKPLEQTVYFAVDTVSNELVVPWPKPLAVSKYQRIEISKIKFIYVAAPHRTDEAGSLTLSFGQEKAEIFDGTNYSDSLLEAMGKQLAFLCDKPFRGELKI